MDKKQCKICQQRVVKVFKCKSKRAYVYVNETGRRWNGLICPDCNSRNAMKYNKAAIAREKENLIEPEKTPTRNCRECEAPLTPAFYFKCDDCQTKLHSSEGQGFYGAEDWGYGALSTVSETTSFKVSEMHLLGAT